MNAVFLIAFLAGGACLSGCGGDSATGPANEEWSETINKKVHVVSEKDSLFLVEANDSLLVFDMEGGVPRIEAGLTVLGIDHGGYVRKVVSTAVAGRRLLLRTEPAYLTDAIFMGRIDTTLTLGFGSSAAAVAIGGEAPAAVSGGGTAASGEMGAAPIEQAPAMDGVSFFGNGLSLSNVTLYSGTAGGAEASVTITRGRIEFEPEMELFSDIRFSLLSGFRAIAEGKLDLDCDVEVVATGPFDLAREMTLASTSAVVISRISSVPVLAVVRLSFVASFDISSEFVGSCGTGIESASHVRFGLRYVPGAWSYVADAVPVFTPRRDAYEFRENAEIVFSIMPRIDVEFFGLPCASLACGPYFGLTELDTGFPVLEWERFAGISGNAEFLGGALTREPLRYEARPGCCRTTLSAGPFRTDEYVFVAQWGSEGAGEGQFGYPKGIASDQEGNVYVVDNWNDNVQKFSADGAFLLRWGTSGSGDGQFRSPEKIAIGDSGTVYVVDGGNCRVQTFSADGVFLQTWGGRGSGDGQFLSPVGIALSRGRVFVTDQASNRVQELSTSGDYLASWGSYGSGEGQFDGAGGIAVRDGNRESDIVITDCHNNRVQRFSLDGLFVASWGSGGSGGGQFDCPVDIAVDADGVVYAADFGNDRVMRFTADGAFVTTLGSTGAGEGQFDHPEGIAVDAEGNLYVVDARNRRVQKFAPREGPEPVASR